MTDLRGASEWEEKVFSFFEEHVANERDLLDGYEQLAEDAPAHVRYLVGLIVADERRHHQIFQELMNAVRGDVELAPVEPSVPHIAPAADLRALRERTAAMIKAERADDRALKQLKKQLREVADLTLWSLLVDVARADTDKHLRILRFIDAHTPSASR